MTLRFDIAVIGGGVIGLALARALAPKTASLAVIDAGATIPPATRAAAGMLAPSFEEALGADALYALSAESLAMWPGFASALETETGVDVDYRGDGVLGVAFDAGGATRLENQRAAIAQRGGDVRMLSGGEARVLEPALSEKVTAALLAPKDAQVDPVKLVVALHASLKKRGAQLIDGVVANATKEAGAWRLGLAHCDVIAAEHIIVATGAARDWPIENMARPPVFPAKGEAYSVQAPASFSLKRVIRAPGAYVCPKAGGRTVVGATEYRDQLDLAVSEDAIAALKAGAAAAVPEMESCAEITRWAGLRPATPDGAPILGRHNGVWLALGHHRNGVLLAPASASALAAEILGDASAIDLAPFRADRFA